MNPFLLVNYHHLHHDDYEGNDHEEDDDPSYQYDFEEKIPPQLITSVVLSLLAQNLVQTCL